jgi:exodeoxyribonuclease VIII
MDTGISASIPFNEYTAIAAINNTVLSKIMNESPAHAKVYMDNPPEPSKAFIIGAAAHKMILEPFDFDSEYVVAPACDRRTKAGKEEYTSFLASVNGREIIDNKTFETVTAMATAVSNHAIAREFLKDGEAETTIVWESDGTKCKTRVDYLTDGIIVDLKTTANAHPDSFKNSIQKYSYYQQLAFYADSYSYIYGNIPVAIIIAVEKEPPYGISVHEFSEDSLEQGRVLYKQALDIYQECIAFNRWPCYPEELNIV